MGSLPHISLAGAYATGTHGSGDTNQMLSSSLKAFSFIDAKGELIHYGIGDENFDACRLGLGSYGLWVSVTLHVVPTYQIRQDVYRQIPWESFYEDPKLGTSAGYSVSLFTKWGGAKIDQLWAKSMIGDLQPPATLYGQSAEGNSLVELAPGVGANLTQQGGVPGPWLDRLPHFRLDATPSAGNEIQTEYFLNRDAAIEAMREINKISSLINPTLVISEIRTIAQDSAWLSPMKQEDKIALHFTWKNERQSVSKAVDLVERALAPFAPIPHWGKVHHFDERRLALRHEKLSEARATFDSLDPAGKFSSEYLRILGVRS